MMLEPQVVWEYPDGTLSIGVDKLVAECCECGRLSQVLTRDEVQCRICDVKSAPKE